MVGIELLEILYGTLERSHALDTQTFVECQIGLVGNAVGCCGVDDLLVEEENRIFFLLDAFRHLADVGIQAYTEKCFLLEYLFY